MTSENYAQRVERTKREATKGSATKTQQRGEEAIRSDLAFVRTPCGGWNHGIARDAAEWRLVNDVQALLDRTDAQRDAALLLANAIPDPQGAFDSPEWHRRMYALAAALGASS